MDVIPSDSTTIEIFFWKQKDHLSLRLFKGTLYVLELDDETKPSPWGRGGILR